MIKAFVSVSGEADVANLTVGRGDNLWVNLKNGNWKDEVIVVLSVGDDGKIKIVCHANAEQAPELKVIKRTWSVSITRKPGQGDEEENDATDV